MTGGPATAPTSASPFDGARAVRWSSALAPLARAFEDRWLDWLPRAGYAVRHGMHPNSAFGLALSLDYARAAKRDELALAIEGAARDWFGTSVPGFDTFQCHAATFSIPPGAERILTDLFGRYRDDLQALPPEGAEQAPTQHYVRYVCDFIAGMTDRYALAEHRRLFDATPELR